MVIKKAELEKKYNSMNNNDLAKELNISIPTLMNLIDKENIERKGSGNAYNKQQIEVI